MRAVFALLILTAVGFSGCASSDDAPTGSADPGTAAPPSLAYVPAEPDLDLDLIEEDLWFEGEGGTTIHARIMRPDTREPVPVIAQFTPYTAPGQNVVLDALLEPAVPNGEGTFDREFVRRGYAFAYGDVRGTGDSSGCLDLRGQLDIQDLAHFADTLAAQPWSTGAVGFIGASYPGSEAHMAALSGNDAVKAVIPIVASTSFYHYHHNSGVPYSGQHSLGGTNTGYTQNAIMPTLNPNSPNYATRYVEEAGCPTHENVVTHGGMDQSGGYYDWWQERNLRPMASTIDTPVLMAQGLADWNVKPDHIATWFNDLPAASKTFIGGQWGHAYPASDDGACPDGYEGEGCVVPWGDWWAYAASFFDTFLKGVDTGMFAGSVAWVQDNNGTWHRSTTFPLHAEEGSGTTLHLRLDGTLAAAPSTDVQDLAWYGCPDDTHNRGTSASIAEEQTVECGERPDQSLAFVSGPLEGDLHISGVPLVNLTIDTQGRTTHLVAVLDVLDSSGAVVRSRENHGYLNPVYRNGLEAPEPVPEQTTYTVSIDLYPQEDLIEAGQRLRLTLSSDDGGRTIESYEEGFVNVAFGEPSIYANTLWLPTRPADMQGVRLE